MDTVLQCCPMLTLRLHVLLSNRCRHVSTLLVEATNPLKVTKKKSNLNVTNGCEILFSACLARCDRASLKHHCLHKGVDRVACIDLIRSKWCLIVCHSLLINTCSVLESMKDHFLFNFLHPDETEYDRKYPIWSRHCRISFTNQTCAVLKFTACITSHTIKSVVDHTLTSLPAHACENLFFWGFFFFLKQYLAQLIPWHPTCLPTPTTNRQRRCYIRGLGADPWGWGVCSVLVGMSEGLYKITKA